MKNVIADKFLFDKKVFEDELKKSKNHLLTFKKAYKNGCNYLINCFTPGENIEFLVKQQTWLIDQLLILAWKEFITSDELSLIAVGGYGRSELLLGSDIDLMILVKPRKKNTYKRQLELFLTFLWDFGLEVGHSVRTTKECQYEAKNDITIMTNIMEARLITGNNVLFEEMCDLTSTKKIWPSHKFFEKKIFEQEQRHKKFNDTACRLEPNIKESPGGLRDIQMILRLFLPSLRALHSVLRTTDTASLHADGVALTSHHMVTYAGQILHPSSPDEHDTVLLETVAFIRDVGNDLKAIGKAHLCNLPHGGVRLLRRPRIHLKAHTLAEGTILQRPRSRLLLRLFPSLTNQLIYRWHLSRNTLQKYT